MPRLVSSKMPALESLDELERRTEVRRATSTSIALLSGPSAVLPARSPENPVTEPDEHAKLALTVAAADRNWG